eukprot:2172711-Pyramimonas_sp.AAC.3
MTGALSAFGCGRGARRLRFEVRRRQGVQDDAQQQRGLGGARCVLRRARLGHDEAVVLSHSTS